MTQMSTSNENGMSRKMNAVIPMEESEAHLNNWNKHHEEDF